MNIAISTTMLASFDQAVQRTRKALAENGFGVLAEIDMKATVKAKLGADMENYLILGACNPALAHRAVSVDRQIGLLLPCNVVVRADPTDQNTVIVEAMNSRLLVEVTGEVHLKPVADEVAAKLQAAIDSLASHHVASSASPAARGGTQCFPPIVCSYLIPRVFRHSDSSLGAIGVAS
jgi:uncharacterized protein (DUF302 family)